MTTIPSREQPSDCNVSAARMTMRRRSLSGRTTSTTASTQPQDYHTTTEQVPTQPQAQLPPTPLPQLIFFVCPRCTHQLPGTRNAFRHNKLDAKLWCNQCRRSRYIKAWRCQCGIPWHICPQHRHEPNRLRNTIAAAKPPHKPPNHTTQTSTSTKRYLGTGQDDNINRWLDLPPTKQPRTTPTHIVLEDPLHPDDTTSSKRVLNTNLLGPKLLAKLARFTPNHNQGQPPTSTSQHDYDSSS